MPNVHFISCIPMLFIRVAVSLLSRKSDSMILSLDFTKSKDIQCGHQIHTLGNQTQEPTVGIMEYVPLFNRNDKDKVLSSA